MSATEEVSLVAVKRPADERAPLSPQQHSRSAGRALWAVAAVGAGMLLLQAALIPLHLRGAGAVATSIAATGWQLLSIVFVFWHGGRRYGVGGIITMFVITYVISNTYENLSIATGFPFGHYNYTHQGTAFLFQVPFTIGLAYFGYGYLAWFVASAILGRGDRLTRTWFGVIVQPLTAAFVMVMWDLVMDPLNSTIAHSWIWHDGGGYNGVPLTNYLGWYLTVWTVYQAFAVVLRLRPRTVREQEDAIGFRAMPVLLYAATALTFVFGFAFTPNSTIVDATGRAWQVHGIWETSVTVMLFTMLFASFLAALALLRERLEARAAKQCGGSRGERPASA
jgi:putative membrane protein